MKAKLLTTGILAILTHLNSRAEVPLTVSTFSASICQGSSVSISASASGGDGGPYTYIWMPGSISGSSIMVSPSANTTYTVTAMDGSGGSASDSSFVTIFSSPVVSMSSDDTSGCAPICINFADQSTVDGTSAIAQWYWDFGDGDSSVIENPIHCFINSGVYDVILTVVSFQGCLSAETYINYIDVYPSPIANFSFSTASGTVNFNDLSTGANGWYWDFGDGNTDTNENPVHTYSINGNYSVVLTVQNSFGCSDTVLYSVVTTGIQEFYLNPSVTISPNPLNSIATIEFENKNGNPQSACFLLFDVLGREIKKIDINDHRTILEKGNLNPGIYFYKIMDRQEIISSGKLTIE